ncbi:hypothetical protein GF386_02135 [Candidatus Pacearchaeota archaeon]|nr:hypothetical protein [Candidatus Pacearchaeota archaeon]MBD3282967.1 hypothetical protein [Candidatus Pacearchaeota archaeon]
MIDTGYLVTIGIFVIYYIGVLFGEREIMQDPRDIIEKFLSVVLLYAGISLIYFSITGNYLFNDSATTYNIYIFLIGFIAVLWTIPNLMNKFTFFRNFVKTKHFHTDDGDDLSKPKKLRK